MLRWTTVGPTVWLLGLTSLFTDISSEMITSTLPLYAMFSLQMSPAAFGLLDGVQQGGASLMRLAGGVVTDRWRQHKAVAVFGYAASAACRLGLLLVGRSPAGLTALTLVDRFGKGVRTSPRDAMISLSTPRAGLAAAFGVHRMLDTLGAMLGPIVAFAVLSRIPQRLRRRVRHELCPGVDWRRHPRRLRSKPGRPGRLDAPADGGSRAAVA